MTAPKPTAVIAHLLGIRIFTEDDLARIGQVAHVLDPEPLGSWDDPRVPELLAQADVLIGHWGCPVLGADLLSAAPRLGLFAYAAGTLKQIVTADVFERGIRVTSGALANAEPVAEFTLAAILFANKDVFWRRLEDPTVRSGRSVAPPTRPVGNRDKTVGIVGASHVGRRVLALLEAFPAIDRLLFDPFVSADEAHQLGARKVELDELCATVDIVSIHAPDLPSTRHLIGADQLAALRTGATVINTARPALIDQDALVAELTAGRLRAVLDVTTPEPLPDDHPLRCLPNAFVTPHLAGSEGTELGLMATHVAEEIRRWSAGEPALNEVAPDQLDRLA